ncbi:putative sugar nucleotidyl transferase [Cardinium endosymbiont of Culicoides punctatus]|uniref:putative sugar nucleotidyl transferase n=1 Tax=Cardinium endosymbiont of Culicoides punctatus TaxID=2304601 RepID=UPI001058B4FD|nr:putative sugar nucleotidyl transferase [Cardinium endosymbiont of Culicoides punctatus]TDG95620.1 hypothetical protein CCPUN_02390 [Cardinium endosymbiont of Culicoides punctatus]
MKVILFDLPEDRIALKPFTFTQPIAKIRVGIVTIEEKWKYHLPGDYCNVSTALSDKDPSIISSDSWYINGTMLPDEVLLETIKTLKNDQALVSGGGTIIAMRLEGHIQIEDIADYVTTKIPFYGEITQIKNKWDIFLLNTQEIEKDLQWYTGNRKSQPILDPYTVTYNKQNIFIEEGVSMKVAVLNAENGPIYIGKNVQLEESVILRGPVAICENSCIQVQSQISGGSTIGPYSNIGGEIYNSVIFGYSNKKHQGFIGNSVIGTWCNIAAGTNLSTTKNNSGVITVWDFAEETYKDTHLSSCGFFMGDYSQSGVNVTLEAGTVIGVASNLTEGKLCEKHVPSFIYRDADGHIMTSVLEKDIKRISTLMQSKHQIFSKEDRDMLCSLFKKTSIHRIKAMI